MSRDKLKEVYLNLELVGEVAFGFSIGFEKEISIKPVWFIFCIINRKIITSEKN